MPSRHSPVRASPGCYVHVPFCSSVCPYCDFSVLLAGAPRRAAWTGGILRELELLAPDAVGPFDTVYLGGGTPSALADGQLEQVLTAVHTRGPTTNDVVVTMEVNPEDVTRQSVAAWRGAGAHAASLGVQSFDDDALQWLGRKHTAKQAAEAASLLEGCGFHWVSLDLIYGYPGHDAQRWKRDLARAIELRPDHLSCYQLTIHGHTVFGKRELRGELSPATDELQTELFFLTHEILRDAGFEAYEVSNFAASRASRSPHNQKYWQHVPYLGVGPSAHSFDGMKRRWNHRKLRVWQNTVDRGHVPLAGEETLTPRQIALEAVMLGLRTTDGLDLDRVENLSGYDLEITNHRLIEALEESGYLTVVGRQLRPTLPGLAIADGLAARFDVV